MNADRIDILHAADRDRAVRRVAHDLEFDLFIAFYTFLDQDLMDRGQLKSIDRQFLQFA